MNLLSKGQCFYSWQLWNRQIYQLHEKMKSFTDWRWKWINCIEQRRDTDIIALERYWAYGEVKCTILPTLIRNINVCVDIHIHANIYMCVYSVCVYIYIYIVCVYIYICICRYSPSLTWRISIEFAIEQRTDIFV